SQAADAAEPSGPSLPPTSQQPADQTRADQHQPGPTQHEVPATGHWQQVVVVLVLVLVLPVLLVLTVLLALVVPAAALLERLLTGLGNTALPVVPLVRRALLVLPFLLALTSLLG